MDSLSSYIFLEVFDILLFSSHCMLVTCIYFYICNAFLVSLASRILVHIPVFIVICIAFHPTYRMLRIACILGGATVVTLNTGNKTFKLGLPPPFIHNRPFPFLPCHPLSLYISASPCIIPVATSHRSFLHFCLSHLFIFDYSAYRLLFIVIK